MAWKILKTAKCNKNRIIDTLKHIGFTFSNPSSNEIYYWTANGDQIKINSEEKALELLELGNLIQLWKTDCEDITISIINGSLIVYFDGFSESESDYIIEQFFEQKIMFEIEYLS